MSENKNMQKLSQDEIDKVSGGYNEVVRDGKVITKEYALEYIATNRPCVECRITDKANYDIIGFYSDGTAEVYCKHCRIHFCIYVQ